MEAFRLGDFILDDADLAQDVRMTLSVN